MNDLPSSQRPVIVHGTWQAQDSPGQCDCDCDCAGSPALATRAYQSPVARYIPAPGTRLHAPPNLVVLDLDREHTICYGPDNPLTVLNRPAMDLFSCLKRSSDIDSIPAHWRAAWGSGTIRASLAEMIALGLLVPEADTGTQQLEVEPTLSCWLHLTDRCNLRCDYCYLPHLGVDMPVEVGYAAIEAVARSAQAHHYRRLKLKYSGGEPLLQFSLLTQLHLYAQAIAAQYDLGLDGVVLSNGTLLRPEMLRIMQALKLRLMISLDSLDPSVGQRPYACGTPSEADARRSVDMALDHGLVPDISITVSSRNAPRICELVSWMLERDLPFSLNLYRAHDLSSHHGDLKLREEAIIASMMAAYQTIAANLPRRSLLASLADRVNLSRPHLRPCAAGHSYLVVDQHGQVAKCQMDMGNTITDVHDRDPLATVRHSSLGMSNPAVIEKSGCRSCRWRFWCAGGCPLVAHRATGQYAQKSPNCNIYEALIPEVLRLEGLRLLKLAARHRVCA
jgi:uncharacterized protein